jgi:hypothetical protein
MNMLKYRSIFMELLPTLSSFDEFKIVKSVEE